MYAFLFVGLLASSALLGRAPFSETLNQHKHQTRSFQLEAVSGVVLT